MLLITFDQVAHTGYMLIVKKEDASGIRIEQYVSPKRTPAQVEADRRYLVSRGLIYDFGK